MRHERSIAAGAAAFALLIASGCGSSSSTSSNTQSTGAAATKTTPTTSTSTAAKETAPPGDIPDTTAFVPYRLAAGGFSVRVPEGWARTGSGAKVTFTSNLNSVTIESRKASGPLSVQSAKASETAALKASQPGFALQSIATVKRSGTTAIRLRYTGTSAANPVTGKRTASADERYLFVHNGTEAVITLAGPKGADNVDPWRKITSSLRWG